MMKALRGGDAVDSAQNVDIGSVDDCDARGRASG